MSLRDRKIILAVSGGIAAYKAAILASRLRKEGAEIRVAMTRAACQFVAPLTFEAIAGHPVYHSLFEQNDSYRMEHIEWARWGDGLIVAPASADFIAKMAHGLADDAPLALILAFRGPVWIAPAMNTAMWDHPATQANLETLRTRGVRIIGPGSGPLACGEVGEGRMAEPEDCLAALEGGFAGDAASDGASALPLTGKTVLITAGPTREPLDPIRFISNRSTGRMGAALAASARKRGARVILIHGPLSVPIPDGVEAVSAECAPEMMRAVQELFAECDYALFTAAVANYRSPDASPQKLKGGKTLQLNLIRNEDIAAWAGEHRRDGQLLIAFAAESENLIESAKKKLEHKHADWIVANQIGAPGVGFVSATNEVILLDRAGRQEHSGNQSKEKIADWIWERIQARSAPSG